MEGIKPIDKTQPWVERTYQRLLKIRGGVEEGVDPGEEQ
jgi:hypothetical protein